MQSDLCAKCGLAVDKTILPEEYYEDYVYYVIKKKNIDGWFDYMWDLVGELKNAYLFDSFKEAQDQLRFLDNPEDFEVQNIVVLYSIK